MQKVPGERADTAKTTEVIRAFTGRRPRGWLGPGVTETWDTPDILLKKATSMFAIGFWTTNR